MEKIWISEIIRKNVCIMLEIVIYNVKIVTFNLNYTNIRL